MSKTMGRSLREELSSIFGAQPRKYWGRGGAGIVFFCPFDGTILLGKRAGWVSDPGTWSYPGGSVEEGWCDTPIDDPITDEDVFFETALRETEEECGSVPRGLVLSHRFEFEDEGFRYVTYMSRLSLEQKLAWKPFPADDEMSEWEWFPLDELPESLHPKLVSSLVGLGLLTDELLTVSSFNL